MSSHPDPPITPDSPTQDSNPPPPPSTAPPPQQQQPRRFPPPCWTQEETLALITAYRDRWYALRRGYLRTADWDAVATAVTTNCPDVTPPKTSAQCRHKMEKLRQRYRAEKQRSLNTPNNGRFFSSWFFYDNMDAMENGTTVQAIRSEKQQQQQQQQGVGVVNVANIDDGYALKSMIDQNLLKLKIKNGGNVNLNNTMEDLPPHPHPNFMFNVSKNNPNPERSNFVNRVPNGYYMGGSNLEEERRHDLEFRVKNGISMKGRRTGRFGDVNGFDHKGGNFGMNNPSFDCDEGSEYNGSSNASDGFHIRSNMGVSSSRRSYNSGNVEQQQPNLGYSKFGGKKGGGVGAKRGRDPMEEMVLSIKLLGEGFIKMEKMKMEMAREVEQMRMEMEMKRNEMILESQKQIVDAFVKVLSEVNKNKNVKTASPES
ncbi:uncharacterized protein LOC132058985 [Lycium ferocissimum]|uniref:uncharacterized protein LOC132058985 n=1 Tax=Lycium ferocissimum TaxID=112874 RepID=UPI0028163813|nr:uncharacterized protein LOC132058985 [Lycium ferocissimum]